MRKYIFLILIFIIPCFAYAAESWKCIAFDSEKKKWEAQNEYKRVAINKALDDCKKESSNPKSCETLTELCENPGKHVIEKSTNHSLAKPKEQTRWQCIALDETAKPWIGLPKFNKYDAALNAKSYCKEKSTKPDTCYINLLTCKNLNESDNEFNTIVDN